MVRLKFCDISSWMCRPWWPRHLQGKLSLRNQNFTCSAMVCLVLVRSVVMHSEKGRRDSRSLAPCVRFGLRDQSHKGQRPLHVQYSESHSDSNFVGFEGEGKDRCRSNQGTIDYQFASLHPKVRSYDNFLLRPVRNDVRRPPLAENSC